MAELLGWRPCPCLLLADIRISMTLAAQASSSWIPVVGAIGAVLGACIAGAIGFASSWYTLRVQRRTTLQTLEHQRAQVFNERFASAADKLGHSSPATRLAGVYALAGLADDWVDQRQVCIDVLCGYMRLPYYVSPNHSGYREGERQVRLSIMRVIRDHLRDGSWDGRTFALHRVTFDGADLSRIKMSGGRLSFYRADFGSGHIDLHGSVFSGGAIVDFREARITGAEIDFRGAEFIDGRTNFGGTTLADGLIDFHGASFRGGTVDLRGIDILGGTIDLRDPADQTSPPERPDPPANGTLLG